MSSPFVTRTLRLKVRRESYRWLGAAAIEVNHVWNWANETSAKAARPYVGKPRWLSGFDLCSLSAGATEFMRYIGADTIQRVTLEYATKRKQFKKGSCAGASAAGAGVPWVGFHSRLRT